MKPLRVAALSFTSDHVTVFSLSTSAPSRFFHWGSCNDENHTQKNAFNAVLFQTRLKVYVKDHVRIELKCIPFNYNYMEAKGVLTTFFLCLGASCFFSTFLSPLCHQSHLIHVHIQLLHRKWSAFGNFLQMAIRQNFVILYQVLKHFLDNNTWWLEHAGTDK